MANYLLKPVFKEIFERDFDSHNFNDRLEMQKTIYLLHSKGVSVGNYNFLWYKHGPYSQTLQNDILKLDKECVKVRFSEEALRVISMLKNAFFEVEHSYTEETWIECLGSIYYIKENQLSSATSDEKILQTLETKKSHLNNRTDNEAALNTIREIFS